MNVKLTVYRHYLAGAIEYRYVYVLAVKNKNCINSINLLPDFQNCHPLCSVRDGISV